MAEILRSPVEVGDFVPIIFRLSYIQTVVVGLGISEPSIVSPPFGDSLSLACFWHVPSMHPQPRDHPRKIDM